jgi:cytochrome oxidase Cu insertion factor (SCO1/SenC/PrrC family)
VNTSNRKSRLTVIAIALLFFGPVLIATLMRMDWWDYEPSRTTNAGVLVEPPVNLDLGTLSWLNPDPNNPLEGKWIMLYPLQGECDNTCKTDITGMRQVHRALGRHQQGVAIIILGSEDALRLEQDEILEVYAKYHLMAGAAEQMGPLLNQAVANASADPDSLSGRAFMLDPAGNLILTYSPPINPGHLSKDLKKLLKWSGRD